MFASLHAFLAFFKLLGGFAGVHFLSGEVLAAVIFSFTALVILAVMTVTSLDVLIKKLGTYWKPIHRFVYLAGALIVVHALLLGSDFVQLSNIIPQIFFTALFVLLCLEAKRLHAHLQSFIPEKYSVPIALILTAGLGAFVYYFLIAPLL